MVGEDLDWAFSVPEFKSYVDDARRVLDTRGGVQIYDVDLTPGDLLIIRWWPGIYVFLGYSDGNQRPNRELGWFKSSRARMFSCDKSMLQHFPADNSVFVISRVTDASG